VTPKYPISVPKIRVHIREYIARASKKREPPARRNAREHDEKIKNAKINRETQKT
ncbi:MAG: hypothetical protein G01um101470_1073, partial [Parcubacteria group bacterium Gr01-1014_70]